MRLILMASPVVMAAFLDLVERLAFPLVLVMEAFLRLEVLPVADLLESTSSRVGSLVLGLRQVATVLLLPNPADCRYPKDPPPPC